MGKKRLKQRIAGMACFSGVYGVNPTEVDDWGINIREQHQRVLKLNLLFSRGGNVT